MDNTVKEFTFNSLRDKFETVCEDVNENGSSAVLTLNNGKKVFLMPEEQYDNISRFMFKRVSAGTLT